MSRGLLVVLAVVVLVVGLLWWRQKRLPGAGAGAAAGDPIQRVPADQTFVSAHQPIPGLTKAVDTTQVKSLIRPPGEKPAPVATDTPRPMPTFTGSRVGTFFTTQRAA